MLQTTAGRASLLLCRALVIALFFLTARTPSIASTTALGGETKKPKPTKRALPAATVRAVVSSVLEKDDGEPRGAAAVAASVDLRGRAPAHSAELGLRSHVSSPEYLKPYAHSHAGTFLSPPARPPATVL